MVAGERPMNTPILIVTLLRADRFRSFLVSASSTGWEASAREDQGVLHRQHYTDWHRVERTLMRYRREIAQLRAQGWRDV
jgi:hypothetical protein